MSQEVIEITEGSGVSGVLSLIWPGAGQIYNREVVRGIIVMLSLVLLPLGMFSLGLLAEMISSDGMMTLIVLLSLVLYLYLYVWQIYDAVHPRAKLFR